MDRLRRANPALVPEGSKESCQLGASADQRGEVPFVPNSLFLDCSPSERFLELTAGLFAFALNQVADTDLIVRFRVVRITPQRFSKRGQRSVDLIGFEQHEPFQVPRVEIVRLDLNDTFGVWQRGVVLVGREVATPQQAMDLRVVWIDCQRGQERLDRLLGLGGIIVAKA